MLLYVQDLKLPNVVRYERNLFGSETNLLEITIPYKTLKYLIIKLITYIILFNFTNTLNKENKNCLGFLSFSLTCLYKVDIANLFGFMLFLSILTLKGQKLQNRDKNGNFDQFWITIELWHILTKRYAGSTNRVTRWPKLSRNPNCSSKNWTPNMVRKT